MTKSKLIATPGKPEVISAYVFDAPRELVFKTYYDPRLIPEWWGPSYLTTFVEKLELKAGGLWRFIQRDSKGNEHGFHGVFHEVIPSEKVVSTFEYEGTPGHVLLSATRFEVEGGQTVINDQSVFQSVEDRDGMFNEGMEDGSDESMERFEELLKKLSGGK
jgi:uncharacterized protein YndB with AHSA1/START domain